MVWASIVYGLDFTFKLEVADGKYDGEVHAFYSLMIKFV